MATQLDARQSVLRTALGMAGTAANASLDTIFPLIDANEAKLFEDRNILLTDGGTVTFTGTQVQFTEALNITLNQKISGAVPQVISLGSTSRTFTNSGDMLVAVLNRTAGTATVSIVAAGSALPAATAANEEVFLIAKRVDAADGTQRLYFRNGSSLNAGQSVRLGQGGSSGSGSGTGDDLDSLIFNASFTDSFSDLPSSTLTSVDVTAGKTQSALFSSTNKYYSLSYDASRTVTGTGTAMTLSGTPAYTVAVGDILRVGTEAKRITAVASQTSYTIESAFASNPSAAAATVSQTVYTKDINNFAADGVSIAASYTEAISQVLVMYNDTTSGTLANITDPSLIGFTASADGSSYSLVQSREANPALQASATNLPTSGTNLFIRFFSNKTSGSGTVNLVGYKAFFHVNSAVESGGILNQAVAFTNAVGTPVNAANPTVVSGKTQITTTFTFPVGLNSGSANGSIFVFLNGQKIPRFINSTLTPDASYTEVSANTIRLDRDYSSQNLSVEIYQSISVVDSNSQNTTSITALQSHQFKNYLLNANFNFWQRGTSGTVANGASVYQADRFYAKNSLGTNGVLTYSRTTGVSNGARYGASVAISTAPTAAQTNGCELYQVIENFTAMELLNQTVSFGAQIRALGNVTSVGIQFVYATTETKPTLTFGTEQTVTVNSSTFTSAALLAQSVGTLPTTTGVVGIRIRILGVSTGNTYSLGNGFVVEQPILNIGSVVAPWSTAGRSTGEELQMLMRFYEAYGVNSDGSYTDARGYYAGTTNSTTSAVLSGNFQVRKRVIPTMSFTAAGNWRVFYAGGTQAATGASNSATATDYWQISLTGMTGFTAGACCTGVNSAGGVLTWSADSEI